MKVLMPLVFLLVLLMSCATTNNAPSSSFQKAIVGENEMVVLERMGVPTRVEHMRDGGKVMVYESLSKGMFLTPYNKPSVWYSSEKNGVGETQGLTFTSNTNTAVNDPKYTIYPTYESFIKVYIDKYGKALKVDHNMTGEQLEVYHERFKHFKD